MLRRSSSVSQIPVPSTNLFNAARSRSRSSIRIRRSSSESKSSLNRLSSKPTPFKQSKITPQQPKNYVRPSSQSKITPSSCQRSVSSSRGCSSSGLRERKTIQKLSSDKKWVSQQHKKVQNFIESSGLFDLDIANPDNLKSFSIKSFIYISSVLLGQIFPAINLTNENYKEVITAKLKVLHYPGQLPNSILKMVYTTQAWPQIIGFFGWLVDKLLLQNYDGDVSLSNLDPEIRVKYQVTQRCKKFLIERHLLFNSNDNTEEKEQKLKDAYVKDLKEILEVNDEYHQSLVKTIAKNSEYLLKKKNENADLVSNIEEMQKQIDDINKEIAEYEELDIVQETELDFELKYLQERKQKTVDTKKMLTENVEKLKETLNNQPCTYKEKLSLLKKIDSLKHEISIKKENIEHAQRMKNELHANLNADREKLENAIVCWNRYLRQWIIKKPQFKSLLLRETGFHQPSFLSEIKQVINQKNTMEQELVKELEVVEKTIQIELTKRHEIELQLEILNKDIEALDKENANTEEQISSTEATIKTVKTDLELLKQSYAQKFQDLQNNDIEKLTLEVEKLKKERDQLEDEVKKFSMKSVSFLLEYRKKILKCAKESQAIVDNVKHQMLKEALKKQEEILADLNKYTEDENRKHAETQ